MVSSSITDIFYEPYLIDVPLDLFGPARKEEEYCSLKTYNKIFLALHINLLHVKTDIHWHAHNRATIFDE